MDVIFGIFGLLSFVLPIIIFVAFAKAIGRASRGNSNPNAWLQTQQQQQNRKRPVQSLNRPSSGAYRGTALPRSVGGRKGSTSLLKMDGGSNLADTFMKDDRQHDWLARQRREEERILLRGDLMDLGASHARSCDADMLKRYHLYAEHDDSVDRGEYH